MSKRSKKPAQPVDTRPVVSKDGVPLARVRRSPSLVPFLAAGFFLGAMLGVALSYSGQDANYTAASTVGYFVLLFGALGTLLGGIAYLIADRRS